MRTLTPQREIRFTGVTAHPMSAKGVLVNRY